MLVASAQLAEERCGIGADPLFGDQAVGEAVELVAERVGISSCVICTDPSPEVVPSASDNPILSPLARSQAIMDQGALARKGILRTSA
jgi:hypothetical protein